MNKPVLVVLAAGMGSRYHGLKQIDPMGKYGEKILDYSMMQSGQALRRSFLSSSRRWSRNLRSRWEKDCAALCR